jgi:hypothetical protein
MSMELKGRNMAQEIKGQAPEWLHEINNILAAVRG